MNEILGNTLPAPESAASAAAAPRFDLYALIHKALRLGMTRALLAAGRCDTGDDDELRATLAQVDELLDFCERHLQHENDFIHPALERVRPGSAREVARDHVHHVEAIADLRDFVGLVANSRTEQRFASMQRLYRALALFVADNLQHMDVEETAHNAVLWAHYSDADLHALHDALVASIPPPEMAFTLRWMLPAMAAPERTGMLQGMRAGMPPEAFLGVVEIARECLPLPDHAKLCRALGVQAVPGLATA